MAKQHKGGLIAGFDQLRAPNAPTIGAATAGDEQVAVAFTAASDAGAGTVSSFAVTGVASGVSTGATGTSSPITVTGLTNGTDVTFSVIAISEFGASPSSGTVEAAATSLNSRALFAGGYPYNNVRQKIEIGTTGNATDFGDLSANRASMGNPSSSTRSVFAGGILSNTQQQGMEYVTIASAGDVTTFGNLSAARRAATSISSNTRGILCGGDTQANGNGAVNIMEYITIANTGNVTDFGNLDENIFSTSCGGSPTRGLIMGGEKTNITNIQQDVHYITIANTGNVTDFGNLSGVICRGNNGPLCSNTRCLIAGGVINSSAGRTDTIEYFTTGTLGNATDFGNLSGTRSVLAGASNHTRGVVAGGQSGNVTTIEYITIANTGNVTDFGDLTNQISQVCGSSGAHGGLS